jgi:hypothetical protein
MAELIQKRNKSVSLIFCSNPQQPVKDRHSVVRNAQLLGTENVRDGRRLILLND